MSSQPKVMPRRATKGSLVSQTYEFPYMRQPKTRTLGQLIYDSKQGKVLGRTPKNWGKSINNSVICANICAANQHPKSLRVFTSLVVYSSPFKDGKPSLLVQLWKRLSSIIEARKYCRLSERSQSIIFSPHLSLCNEFTPHASNIRVQWDDDLLPRARSYQLWKRENIFYSSSELRYRPISFSFAMSIEHCAIFISLRWIIKKRNNETSLLVAAQDSAADKGES